MWFQFHESDPKGFTMSRRRKYTAVNFLVDITLSCLTGGLWLIWIFCREMRSR